MKNKYLLILWEEVYEKKCLQKIAKIYEDFFYFASFV